MNPVVLQTCCKTRKIRTSLVKCALWNKFSPNLFKVYVSTEYITTYVDPWSGLFQKRLQFKKTILRLRNNCSCNFIRVIDHCLEREAARHGQAGKDGKAEGRWVTTASHSNILCRRTAWRCSSCIAANQLPCSCLAFCLNNPHVTNNKLLSLGCH